MKKTTFCFSLFTISHLLILLLIICLLGCTDIDQETFEIKSPDNSIELSFRMIDGSPQYMVRSDADTVMLWSSLGMTMENGNFATGMTVGYISDQVLIEDNYHLHHGKKSNIAYRGVERTVRLINTNEEVLDIIFRIANDGVAFRYFYPQTSDVINRVLNEASAFQFPAQTKAWMQPISPAKSGWKRTNPSYEEQYIGEIESGIKSTLGAGWAFPALFNYGSKWLLISETGLGGNYCGSRLEAVANQNVLQITFPSALEVMPEGGHLPNSLLPWYSPWRFITIGSLATITESTMGTDLATPAVPMDTIGIEPGIASWSWVMYKDDSTVYDVQKRFITYAAEMHWRYCLIDADWDRKIGIEKIKELVDYGNSMGVGVILWYNSAGSWNDAPYTPRDKMLTRASRQQEFAMLRNIGVKGLKIDFFGGDGQSVIQYYIDILDDAAKFGLLVNFHGATLPRGWQRTYPNLMTMEAIKGEEFVTFFQETADAQPVHCATIPFTRNVFDPMDFAPMVFGEIPNINRVTSNAFELALPTLFTSGIQHMAATPECMLSVPDYVKTHLQSLPVVWDETRFVDGYPGKYVIIARRTGQKWYVSGINATNAEIAICMDLSFITPNTGYLITDGDSNRTFQKTTINHNSISPILLQLKSNGGFVLVI